MKQTYIKSVVAPGAIISRGVFLEPAEKRRLNPLRGFKPQATATVKQAVTSVQGAEYLRLSNGQLIKESTFFKNRALFNLSDILPSLSNDTCPNAQN